MLLAVTAALLTGRFSFLELGLCLRSIRFVFLKRIKLLSRMLALL